MDVIQAKVAKPGLALLVVDTAGLITRGGVGWEVRRVVAIKGAEELCERSGRSINLTDNGRGRPATSLALQCTASGLAPIVLSTL